jgi:preprotein translocase SecE subunit
VAKAVRGQPVRPRPPVGPPAGAGERNYFASVVEELRKVVWPTWNELWRMTGVVVTTVILMAVIVSAADYGLGFVVKQLYSSSTTSSTQSGSQIKPGATPAPSNSSAATSAPGTTAPVTP